VSFEVLLGRAGRRRFRKGLGGRLRGWAFRTTAEKRVAREVGIALSNRSRSSGDRRCCRVVGVIRRQCASTIVTSIAAVLLRRRRALVSSW